MCKICSQEFVKGKYITDICLDCIESRVVRVDHRGSLGRRLYKHIIYGLYKNGVLVYIGVTGNYQNRFHAHYLTKDFDEMKIVRSFKDREMADQFEITAIQLHKPPLNIKYDEILEVHDWPKNQWDRDLNKF